MTMAIGGINGGPCVSGVANCPCCGYPTMVENWTVPELCPECVEYECDGECAVPMDDPWPYACDARDR
jgi:hypothetical protein